MSDLSHLKFLVTPPHPCSYLEDREAVTLFVDPTTKMTNQLYSAMSALGFRRSGKHVYRPHCGSCQACVPIRIPVDEFQPRRRHRRILSRNQDLVVEVRAAEYRDEYFALYCDYMASRHADGDMYPPSPDQFQSFLLSTWSDTHFLVFSRGEQPLAVAVIDVINDGLSSIYSFFDPREERRSLGSNAILHQIELARKMGLSHLYLGYWIEECRKMTYKSEYQPFEQYRANRWVRIDDHTTNLEFPAGN
ncbi:MAG: arginyltransferase [Gammaproteobacteria bacterium]|jgi:arginine-tRNA-protein transferase|nr:arginyltransferase [Gammaproteobacteria bacterium]